MTEYNGYLVDRVADRFGNQYEVEMMDGIVTVSGRGWKARVWADAPYEWETIGGSEGRVASGVSDCVESAVDAAVDCFGEGPAPTRPFAGLQLISPIPQSWLSEPPPRLPRPSESP